MCHHVFNNHVYSRGHQCSSSSESLPPHSIPESSNSLKSKNILQINSWLFIILCAVAPWPRPIDSFRDCGMAPFVFERELTISLWGISWSNVLIVWIKQKWQKQYSDSEAIAFAETPAETQLSSPLARKHSLLPSLHVRCLFPGPSCPQTLPW